MDEEVEGSRHGAKAIEAASPVTDVRGESKAAREYYILARSYAIGGGWICH